MTEVLSTPILVLSPHPDDAALSVGGLLLRHSNASVVTAFTADPPRERPRALQRVALPEVRRAEDEAAMEMLGVTAHLLDLADAVDRFGAGNQRLYPRHPSLFGPVDPADTPICDQLVRTIGSLLGERLLLCPMAVGAHVDHQLCAFAGRRLARAGRQVLFYEDAPYVYPDSGPVLQGDSVIRAAARIRARIGGFEDISIDSAAKTEVVACYSTQIMDLFGDIAGYKRSADSHFESLGSEIERLHHLRV